MVVRPHRERNAWSVVLQLYLTRFDGGEANRQRIEATYKKVVG